MCAASKVKCSKKRPICSRCNRLHYPCFYSPTRRNGRPNPTGRNSSQRTPRPTAVASNQHRVNIQSNQNSGPDSNASPDGEQNSQMYDSGGETANALPGSEYGFDSDTILEPQIGFPWTDHSIFSLSHHTREKYLMRDVGVFDFEDRDNRATSSQAGGSCRQSTSSDDTSTLSPNTSAHGSGDSITTDRMSDVLAFAQVSPSNPSEHDCAMVAIHILQDLNVRITQRLSSATSIARSESSTLGSLIKTTSTILVCSCSQKTDVGLLVAAVCATILDIYEALLRDFTMSNTPRASTDDPTYVTISSNNDMVRDAGPMVSRAYHLQDGPSEEETIMLILGRLSNLANLVTQLCKRYSQDAEEASAEFLTALAGSLKTRLMSMIDEATDWLIHV